MVEARVAFRRFSAMFTELVSAVGGLMGAGLALFIAFCIAVGVLVGALLFALLPFVFFFRTGE